MRVVSYGGGVQSTALLVLAAQGVIEFPTFLFSNVGDDSELPATVSYVREVAIPYGKEHGIEVLELRHPRETLYENLTKEGSRSVRIPVRMDNGAPGTRSCTDIWKIRVIGRYLRAHGATPAEPATVGVGFSTDEFHRASNTKDAPYERRIFPLLELGYDRSRCSAAIARAGLPVPPKSSCYFCPFQRPQTWAEKRRDEPDLFWKSVELERTLNRRRDELGKDHVFLTRFGRPLDEAIGEAQQTLFDAEGPEECDDGYCWT
jgi:3'-phosphoadenosine 5'-phosphosulfate sulfotransferase (PAPS reductase)/FAD synthetase